MDRKELSKALKVLGVNPPDELRASIYLDYLNQAKTYFQTTLKGAAPNGFSSNYDFVGNALNDSSLLNELAVILDFYICPAVNANIQLQYKLGDGKPNLAYYGVYFDQNILNDNYENNILNFYKTYPIAKYVMDKLFENFKNNIKLCCARVIKDRNTLVTFFDKIEPPDTNFNIVRLIKIKSTGSDFHKGGKQVLILTFSTTYKKNLQLISVTVSGQLKVVYKPGDLEADCLLAGNSAALKKVNPEFMENSLFEIYNNQLEVYKKSNSSFTGIAIDTYRILPIVYNSQNGGGLPLLIRDSYGYIEFLNYDLYWDTINFWGYYPLAQSNYLIFKLQDATSIIKAFYQKAGAICAIAATFSIVDLHIENFRVSNYNPYPIDMEISLTNVVDDITATLLIDNTYGALNKSTEDFKGTGSQWKVILNDANKVQIVQENRPETFCNRLYEWGFKKEKRLVPIKDNFLLQGFEDGMKILQACVKEINILTEWYNRLKNNVVVRYMPFSTSIFKTIVVNVCIIQFEGSSPGVPFLPTLRTKNDQRLQIEFEKYINHGLPNFLAFLYDQCGPDYENLDIPVFYYLIGDQSLNLVNSRGELVTIPATILDPPEPCQPRVGRNTFFDVAPTQNNVWIGQVQILSNEERFNARFKMIYETILTGLGIEQRPSNPGALIPQNT
jgi:hypothetical protein